MAFCLYITCHSGRSLLLHAVHIKCRKKELVQTVALPLGKEYIKQYYSADFILKDYVINGPYVHSTVFLYGYIKGHEGQTVSITYDYKKKEIIDVSGPGWFIDSRNPKKN